MATTTDLITANGNFVINGFRGGESYTVAIFGTWDGATVSLQVSFDDGTTYQQVMPSMTGLTDNGGGVFSIGDPSAMLRVAVSGVGASTSVNVQVHPIRN